MYTNIQVKKLWIMRSWIQEDEQNSIIAQYARHHAHLYTKHILLYLVIKVLGILSQDIDDPHNGEALLVEIVKLSVTNRGFSLAASWMEEYKNNTCKTTEILINCTSLFCTIALNITFLILALSDSLSTTCLVEVCALIFQLQQKRLE